MFALARAVPARLCHRQEIADNHSPASEHGMATDAIVRAAAFTRDDLWRRAQARLPGERCRPAFAKPTSTGGQRCRKPPFGKNPCEILRAPGTRRRKTFSVTMPRTPSCGLRGAVGRDMARAWATSAGRSARANSATARAKFQCRALQWWCQAGSRRSGAGNCAKHTQLGPRSRPRRPLAAARERRRWGCSAAAQVVGGLGK